MKDKETLKDIARAFYGDPEMDFLIAFFNDLETGAQPATGRTLKIISLEPNLLSRVIDVEKEFQRAEELFKGKKFEEAIAAANKLLRYDPDNEKATRLVNASY